MSLQQTYNEQLINLIDQQMIVFAFGKINGEKPQGFRYVKLTGAIRTQPVRFLTSAHPI